MDCFAAQQLLAIMLSVCLDRCDAGVATVKSVPRPQWCRLAQTHHDDHHVARSVEPPLTLPLASSLQCSTDASSGRSADTFTPISQTLHYQHKALHPIHSSNTLSLMLIISAFMSNIQIKACLSNNITTIGKIGDVRPSQSLSLVLVKLNAINTDIHK